MFANALGCETYALTHSPRKKDDALKMGAKEVIVTGEKDWAENHKFKFDFLLNTADATDKFNLQVR